MIMLDRAGNGAPGAQQKAAPAMAAAGAPEEPQVEEIKVEDIPF